MKIRQSKKTIIFLCIFVPILFTAIFAKNFYRSFVRSLGYSQKKFIKSFLPPILFQEIDCDRCIFNKYELSEKKKGKDINIGIMQDTIISKNLNLEKFNLTNGFYSGIKNNFPGSGFIDFHKENLVLLSSRGIIAYYPYNEKPKVLFQIKNNINDFIGIKQFNKKNWFSIKDLRINEDKIYVSFTEEIKTDCWNTSIIEGQLNYDEIKFKKLFSPKNCINSNGGVDREFNAHQSGGRIINLNQKNLLFSLGDYRSRYLAQERNTPNGKLIRINLDSIGQYELISLGHRNPQGLLFDADRKFILETEHGPQGGDEINLIEPSKVNKISPLNYGWPISSAGEHYKGRIEKNKKKYKKYPLYDSHEKYGFIEPLISFVPSIGISEIVKIGNGNYVTSSLKDKSLYFFSLNKDNQLQNLKRVEVGERIRDLAYKDDFLFLFLEDSASIGRIQIN